MLLLRNCPFCDNGCHKEGKMAVYRRGEKWVSDIAIGGRGGRRIRKTLPSKRLAIAYEQDVRLKELQV